MATISKKDADYRTQPGLKDHRCGTCAMFRAARSMANSDHCTLVDGPIHALDVCDYWEAKSKK